MFKSTLNDCVPLPEGSILVLDMLIRYISPFFHLSFTILVFYRVGKDTSGRRRNPPSLEFSASFGEHPNLRLTPTTAFLNSSSLSIA